MKIINEADFRKEIKSSPARAYLFFGEEDYMKSFALSKAIEAISPDKSLSFFNEMKLDALTYSPDALLDAMMPLPMAAERKIIILSGLDFNAMDKSELDALCATLSCLDEYDYNTVIINASSDRFDAGFLPKRPSSMLQKLCEYATAVQFNKNSPARLASWVAKHYEHNGVSASPELCALTVERCGRDMFNLASETDKISFYVASQGRCAVEESDILKASTPAAEHDAYALTNAISSRQRDAALNIVKDMKQRRLDPIIIMGEITKSVCNIYVVLSLSEFGLTSREISDMLKMHEYRISLILKSGTSLHTCRHMMQLCRDADLELKLGRGGYSALEKLICSI